MKGNSPSLNDLTGRVFGRLTALEYSGLSKNNSHTWRCLCVCGTESIVHAARLKSGHTQSCGCLHKERTLAANTVHGHAREKFKTRTWKIWAGMLNRCKTSGKEGRHYASRGIRVCERWHEFANFLFDMGEAPDRMTLERRDVNGNYEPSNCIWASMKVQQNNRTNNRRIEHDGMNLTVAQWAELRGWPAGVIYNRLNDGWSDIDAITRAPRYLKNAK